MPVNSSLAQMMQELNEDEKPVKKESKQVKVMKAEVMKKPASAVGSGENPQEFEPFQSLQFLNGVGDSPAFGSWRRTPGCVAERVRPRRRSDNVGGARRPNLVRIRRTRLATAM